MALRKPLVLVQGVVQQLQSGDTLDAPQSGGDVLAQTNDEATPIVIGTPVYNDVADGVKKGKADAATTARVLGLVRDASITNGVSGAIQVNGVLGFTSTAQVDASFGTTGGFTVGTRYFLSPTTAGLGTVTPPSTGGQYVVELGVAVSTIELNLSSPFKPILL
jgi:hypothetical protein